MTTEVIIKNKSGMVLAADSAVTVTGVGPYGQQSKVYNSANKLFTLSKVAPVGVLVYNSSLINSIPIELVIKEFREKGKRYNTLKEYYEALIKFIEKFIADNAQSYSLNYYFSNFCNTFLNITNEEKKKRQGAFIFSEYVRQVIEELCQLNHQRECDKELKGLPLDYVAKKCEKSPDIKKEFIKLKEQSEYDGQIKDLIPLFYEFLKLNICQSYTGLAICGYGDKEFFPKVYKIHIYGNIEGTLLIGNFEAHENQEAEIIPLAQKQMIETFIKGVSESIYTNLENLYFMNFDVFINSVIPSLKEDIDPHGLRCRLISLFQNNVERFKNIIYEVEEKPLIQTVNHLSREEMAELAENLINIQVLKYKVSPELETVGGPIDVAIISKHDGFVWKKRKLYFPKDLNFQFFENYFK